MQDQMIINLFLERSEAAITELSKKYGKQCKSLAYRILQNEQDAEECVNDAYLAAWNAIPPQSPDPLGAYICRITRNLSLKKYHFNTAQKRNSRYDLILEELAECIDGKAGVEDAVLAKELAGQIHSFMDTLKVKDRVMFVRRYYFCDPVMQIAGEMGVSTNYVTVHLHRTREKLKGFLKKEGFLL